MNRREKFLLFGLLGFVIGQLVVLTVRLAIQ